jgi:hypothetical protein
MKKKSLGPAKDFFVKACHFTAVGTFNPSNPSARPGNVRIHKVILYVGKL